VKTDKRFTISIIVREGDALACRILAIGPLHGYSIAESIQDTSDAARIARTAGIRVGSFRKQSARQVLPADLPNGDREGVTMGLPTLRKRTAFRQVSW
jgi:hypothetical protein